MRWFRSDGRGDYMGRDLKVALSNRGFFHELTTPHSSELTGRAERLKRTLRGMARSAMVGAGNRTQENHRAGAVCYANIARNLLRIRSYIARKTIFEVVHGRKPDLSNFRLSGGRVYTHIPGK